MIVCWRTVRVPEDDRSRFLPWIEENRALRQDHGILFEIVLERGPAGIERGLGRKEI